MSSYFWRAWIVCGILDLVYACIATMLVGGTPQAVLLSVASGPFGDAVANWGETAAFAGFLVHFAIMAVMVAGYGLLVSRSPLGRMNPWLAGTLYGFALYLVMYWVVLPLRFPSAFPQTDPIRIAGALFPHIVLVGIPMALIARRYLMKELPR